MVDVTANRASRKWTRREQVGRVFWAAAQPFWRLSPRFCWGWRRWLLRRFGAMVSSDVHIYPSVKISIPWNLTLCNQCAVGDRVILYALGPIKIGERTTISQGSHLCAGTHDYNKADRPLIKLPIVIGNDCWICTDAFIGAGVTVCSQAIVGARAVAMKDVPENAVVAGNPARELRKGTL